MFAALGFTVNVVASFCRVDRRGPAGLGGDAVTALAARVANPGILILKEEDADLGGLGGVFSASGTLL